MGDRRHIVVVEDETHLADGIKFNLEAEGYRVSCFGDGQSALEFIQVNHESVDLVILDLMLPSMSGYAVCEALRKSGFFMPVLILSARTLPEDRSRGFDVGADQYLTKPFELDELLSRTKNLLARYDRDTGAQGEPVPSSATYLFGDATINFDTFEVQVRGTPVRLTRLEFRLLEYFIRNAGRVIPRSELLVEVWDMPPQIKTRAPDQIMRRLRKAFEPDPTEPKYFLTIRDAGYRFIPDS